MRKLPGKRATQRKDFFGATNMTTTADFDTKGRRGRKKEDGKVILFLHGKCSLRLSAANSDGAYLLAAPRL